MNKLVQFDQNFFIDPKKGIIKKKYIYIYIYIWAILGYISKIDGKINSGHKGLNLINNTQLPYVNNLYIYKSPSKYLIIQSSSFIMKTNSPYLTHSYY